MEKNQSYFNGEEGVSLWFWRPRSRLVGGWGQLGGDPRPLSGRADGAGCRRVRLPRGGRAGRGALRGKGPRLSLPSVLESGGRGCPLPRSCPRGPGTWFWNKRGGEDGGQASGALFGWAGWNKEPGLLLPTGFLTGDVSPGQRPHGVIKGTSRFTCSACSPAQVGSYISRCLNWASFIPLGPQTPRHLLGGLFLFQPVLSALRRGLPHLSPPRVSPRLPRAHSGSRSSWV